MVDASGFGFGDVPCRTLDLVTKVEINEIKKGDVVQAGFNNNCVLALFV